MNQPGRSSILEPLRKLGLTWVAVGLMLASAGVEAKRPVGEAGTIAQSALPTEAKQTQRLIHAGGPFPFSKDGVVFGNRERILPRRERGFYREYTVPTSGSRNRGAWRIVCGGARPTQPDACYFTADHYASFQLIAQ